LICDQPVSRNTKAKGMKKGNHPVDIKINRSIGGQHPSNEFLVFAFTRSHAIFSLWMPGKNIRA